MVSTFMCSFVLAHQNASIGAGEHGKSVGKEHLFPARRTFMLPQSKPSGESDNFVDMYELLEGVHAGHQKKIWGLTFLLLEAA